MIFGVAPGTVSEIYTIPGVSVPAIVSVPGFPSTAVAITSVGFSQAANVQFMHTLRRVIYIYAFGERMGTIEVNGVAFYNVCSPGGVNISASGVPLLMQFYSANSVSVKKFPLSITLAGTGIKGFIKQIRTTFSDTTHGILGFSIIFASLPEMWNVNNM